MRIDRFAEFVRDGKDRYSAPVYIRGLPWQINARTMEVDQSNNQDEQSPSKNLEAYLYCCKYSTNQTWECRATFTLRVVAQKDGVMDIHRNSTRNFTGKACGWKNFAACDFLLDPENGFIKDDTVIVQAHVKPLNVKMISGIHSTANGQLFSSSAKYPSDFVLIIQDKEVHVQKSFLAMHSDYFKDQFAKHERVKRAILQDIHYDDFIELLTVIYPTAHPITCENVETITELAFKFYMGDLLRRCEVFLMENISKFHRAATLLMSEWYGLVDLTEKIIDQIENIADIKAMKPEYDVLSDRTKRMLFDKICSAGPVSNPVPELESMSITTDRATEILQELVSSARCPPSGVLIVENNRIPVHKEHLALYSEYFRAMFQGEFAERNKDEIVLEEVGYNEILELLQIIYPTQQHFSINEKNVGVILKMADRFIMPAILERCKMLLENSTNIKAARKLWLAQRYNLPDLQANYIKKYKTMSDVEELKAEPEFGLFDDKTRALILDNIVS
ncbi:BTB/POZ domain-containing protein [Ditylenchus destructor]|uniref:BTB/POZ domain-containing protein n=1 Tax=Ditylenchus destructor TaxID=166010 RepID=A0AAD4MFV0_9BILA|nr:BTB/POZ domain-containing protein [Ditylenchus destructor]